MQVVFTRSALDDIVCLVTTITKESPAEARVGVV